MFDLINVTGVGSDCTSGYRVNFFDTYTVKEFVNEMLRKYPVDFGGIFIQVNGMTKASMEYFKGDIRSKQDCSDQILESTIKSATASGGWGRQDYYIEL